MSGLATCYVVEATYVEGAAQRRAPFRQEHIERIEKLIAEGALAVAGAFDDLSASFLVFALKSRDSVVAVIESDVYWREGIWSAYRIRKLNRVTV